MQEYKTSISRLSDEQFKKLWHHRAKGRWENIQPLEAFKRLMQESTELLEAVLNGYSVEEAWKEAADVANFALIIAEAYERQRKVEEGVATKSTL